MLFNFSILNTLKHAELSVTLTLLILIIIVRSYADILTLLTLFELTRACWILLLKIFWDHL